MSAWIQFKGVDLNYGHKVLNVSRASNGRWDLKVKNNSTGETGVPSTMLSGASGLTGVGGIGVTGVSGDAVSTPGASLARSHTLRLRSRLPERASLPLAELARARINCECPALARSRE